MSYRGRLTAEVQKLLWNSPDHREHGLTDEQIMALRVDEIDVSPTTPDTFLAVDCSIPTTTTEPTETPDPVLRARVFLDQRTTLRVLLKGLLDETNVPRAPRRSQREITEEHNQRIYEQLRLSVDDQR